MIKADIAIELNPFTVPNFVTLVHKAGFDKGSIALSELPAETLDKLCNEFRKNVFKRAGVEVPPTAA